MQRLYRSRARTGRRRATIKKVDAIQIKGPQREKTGDNIPAISHDTLQYGAEGDPQHKCRVNSE